MNTAFQLNDLDTEASPLDMLEDFCTDKNWTFERTEYDVLTAHIKGKHDNFRLKLSWDDEFETLHIICAYDMKINASMMDDVAYTLKNLNEELWLGHFEVPVLEGDQSGTPRFRHAHLFRNHMAPGGMDTAHDLIALAVQMCEEHLSLFKLLATNIELDTDTIDFMIRNTVGEA